MKNEFLLGIDLGTMFIKSVLFTSMGETVSLSGREVSVEYPIPGWAEQDPNNLWDLTCLTIRECIKKAKVDPSEIIGVSLTGQMHGTFLTDEHGKPSRKKAIIWLDTRSKDILKNMYETGMVDDIYNISGWRLIPSMQVMHLGWLRDNEPEMLEKSSYFLACKDYIRYQLTNKPYMDFTDASITGLFDTSKGQWSSKLCELLRIPERILPEIKGSWEYAGTITKQAEGATGLKEGTSVAVGAGDICSTALGAGTVEKGQLCVIIGTAGIYELVYDKFILDPDKRYSIACHAVPNRYLLESSQIAAGAALRWFKDQFCYEERIDAEKRGVSVYKVIDEKAEKSPIGANGVIFHPFLQGERAPFVNPNARGILFGLGLWSQKPDILRAILEGVAFAARDNIDVFRDRKIEIKEIVITGGGAKSKLWCQIYADVLDSKIIVPKIEECGALGAAIEAGVVSGVYRNPTEGIRICFKKEREFFPSKENVRTYKKIFNLYKLLYKDLWNTYDFAASIYA